MKELISRQVVLAEVKTWFDDRDMDGSHMLAVLENIPIEGEWISVKEKLPKDYEDVVIIMRDGASSWYRVAYREYGGWSFGGGRRVNDEVTHWMPLPEPPKEE